MKWIPVMVVEALTLATPALAEPCKAIPDRRPANPGRSSLEVEP